jgi:hypothetical protein
MNWSPLPGLETKVHVSRYGQVAAFRNAYHLSAIPEEASRAGLETTQETELVWDKDGKIWDAVPSKEVAVKILEMIWPEEAMKLQGMA